MAESAPDGDEECARRQLAAEAQDELATNCSETMSTTNEEEEEDDEPSGLHQLQVASRFRRPTDPRPAAANQTIEQQRMHSVRNRLGTPRRPSPFEHQHDCDEAGYASTRPAPDAGCLIDSGALLTNHPDGQHQAGPIANLATRDECVSPGTELSGASGATQAPPSYGTATRACATLDAGQLQMLQQQRAAPFGWPTSGGPNPPQYSAPAHSHSNPVLGAEGVELFLQQEARCSGVASGGGQLKIATEQWQQQQLQQQRQPAALGTNAARYLSQQQQPHHLIDLRPGCAPDNNQEPSRLQLFRRQGPFAGASDQMSSERPINHVISGCASMQQQQWLRQSNQYIGLGAGAGAPGASGGARANQTAALEVAARIMDNSARAAAGPRHRAQPFPDSPMVGGGRLAAEAPAATTCSISNQSRDLGARDSESLDERRQHRKRRRHRSAAGPAASPPGGPAAGDHQQRAPGQVPCTMVPRLAQRNNGNFMAPATTATADGPPARKAQRKAISAHCWLIDSSDEQTYGTAGAGANLAGLLAPSSSNQVARARHAYATTGHHQQQHLTVAVMLQEEDRKSSTLGAPRPRLGLEERRCLSVSQHLAKGLTSRSPTMRRTLAGHNHQAEPAPTKARGFKVRPAGAAGQPASVSRLEPGTWSADESDATETGAGTCRSRRRPASSSAASTVVSLSAILAFVSGLVKRAPSQGQRARQLKSASSGQLAHPAAHCCPAASSISGSISIAPYTAASLAISSSSSTSAYATGSSHSQSSHSNNHHQARQAQQLQPIVMSKLKPTPGQGSLFYHSSGAARQLAPPSSHGYEYCADLAPAAGQSTDPLIIETQFSRCDDTDKQRRQASPASSSSAGLEEPSAGAAGPHDRQHRQQESRLAQTLMSDNELISDAPNSSHQPATGQPRAFRLASAGLPAVSTSARRRWWWNSLKQWLLRRPCSRATRRLAGGGSPSTATAHQPRPSEPTAARYKSLRASQPPGCCTSSTLQNVISLAKADRVFRCRLLASFLVACLLLALICVLANLIYRRSNGAGQYYQFKHGQQQQHRLNGNKFSLFIDDSDYDLSWLWPVDPSLAGTNDQQQQYEHSMAEPNPPLGGPNEHTKGGPGTGTKKQFNNLDNSLKSLLLVIDQSDRLHQFQQSMTHLTNIQLANDNFIDITQLAHLLASQINSKGADVGKTPDLPGQLFARPMVNHGHNGSYDRLTTDQQANTSRDNNEQLQPALTTDKQQPILSQMDHDLISLTLLSNLHWPLVKWRHQSQQSIAANFLSFAISPTPTISFGGTQTIRNLLSSLLLAESIDSVAASASNDLTTNLGQFQRLNSALKSIAHHLLSCSVLLNNRAAFDYESTNEASSEDSLANGFDRNARQHYPNLKFKLCRLLISRYKRMMLVLGQLQHSHLFELHDQAIELPASLFVPPTSNTRDNQFGSGTGRHQKNLLGFLLDRLALLDIQTLAEATLANNLDSLLDQELDTTLNEAGAEWFESGQQLALIDALLNQDILPIVSDSDAPALAHKNSASSSLASSSSYSLYELTKSVIGEGPLSLNLDLERNQEFQMRFHQSKSDNYDNWRDTFIIRDLLYPWPSANRLAQSVIPTNYDLFLHPNLTTKLVLGMVKIDFHLERPTRFIVLNCANLNLVELSVRLKQNNNVHMPNQSAGIGAGSFRQVPIRRIVKSNKNEQIYVEFYEQIMPFSDGDGAMGKSKANSKSNLNQIRTNEQANGLEFGELPSAGHDNHQSGHHEHDRNHFVINISFNKTNLMLDSGQQQQEQGLEFVQYVDYFAQPEAELKTLLYTQFEPNNARRLFPCFDEPHLKARFQLNLVHDHNHQVLFNSPKRERVPYTSDGFNQMSVFETIPIPLSTYLVAFLVCDSQNIKSITSRVGQLSIGSSIKQSQMPTIRQEVGRFAESTANKHIQVQISAQFEHLSQAEFVSQLVAQLLAFYQTHLQFAYPLDKLDLIAIPKALPTHQQTTNGYQNHFIGQQRDQSEQNLQSDTMENFGLLSFRAPLLLVDSNLISQNLMEQISLIVSHQLAHQYFGNIVSLRNWQDLWLYEALCQYLESVALGQVQTDWRLEEQFPVTTIQETLAQEQYIDTSSTPSPDIPIGLIQTETSPLAAGTNVGSDNKGPPEVEAERRQQSHQENWWIGLDPTEIPTQTNPLTNGLRKSSAILHMLLFNLLPSTESQARLLRRCLTAYRYKTMSSVQFWRQFGEQLVLESSLERIPLDFNGLDSFSANSDTLEHESLSVSPQLEQLVGHSNQSSEHVVFVRPHLSLSDNIKSHLDQQQGPTHADVHRARARPHKLVDNLELVVDSWLYTRGFPMITASSFRDRLQLHQERFVFAWWPDEPTTNTSVSPSSSVDQQFRIRRQSIDDARLPNADDIWPIPLMYVSRLGPKTPRFVWFNKRDLEISLSGADPNYSSQTVQFHKEQQTTEIGSNSRKLPAHYSWFKLNVNQTSLVRVNYDERNWEALTELLVKSHYSNHQLSPLDRANLLDDAMTLMRCGKLSVGIAMNLTLYLEVGEREFQPWASALQHLDQLQTLLNQNPLWHRYVLKLIQPISVVIGWKDDGPHLMRKLRRILFNVALKFGDEKLVNKAKQEFKVWLKSGRFIVPNLQELVYVAGVRYGDQQEWFHCWQKYLQLVALDLPPAEPLNQTTNGLNGAQNSGVSQPIWQAGAAAGTSGVGGLIERQIGDLAATSAGSSELADGSNGENEKRQLLTALASTQNTWLLEQFLNYSLDSTKIQTYHLKHVVQTLGNNPVARLYLWRFVRLNWFALLERYSSNRVSPADSGLVSRQRMQTGEILETMVLESTKHFATKLDYDEVKAFFDAKRKQQQRIAESSQQQHLKSSWNLSIERAVQQSLHVIKANIHWRDFVEPKLTRWLSHYNNIIVN